MTPSNDTFSPDDTQPLSSAGIERRERILGDALRLGGRCRRRRGRRKAVAIALPVMMLAAGVPWLLRQRTPGIATVQPARPTTETAPSVANRSPDIVASTDRVRIEIIADDPTIVARYATTAVPDRVERIDDRQLFKELADAHLRGGIATVDQQSRLILAR